MPPLRKALEQINRHAHDLEGRLIETTRASEFRRHVHEVPFRQRTANGGTPLLKEPGMFQ